MSLRPLQRVRVVPLVPLGPVRRRVVDLALGFHLDRQPRARRAHHHINRLAQRGGRLWRRFQAGARVDGRVVERGRECMEHGVAPRAQRERAELVEELEQKDVVGGVRRGARPQLLGGRGRRLGDAAGPTHPRGEGADGTLHSWAELGGRREAVVNEGVTLRGRVVDAKVVLCMRVALGSTLRAAVGLILGRLDREVGNLRRRGVAVEARAEVGALAADGPRPTAPGWRPRGVIRVARRVAAGEAPATRHTSQVDGVAHAGGAWAAHAQHDRVGARGARLAQLNRVVSARGGVPMVHLPIERHQQVAT
mmetsp:Transcript_51198/g.150869  ORF Transcript_51198/g.150869 Transcript_51198/m.150869 type:complete len:308 (-) Transcript_51198:328-1251(-)